MSRCLYIMPLRFQTRQQRCETLEWNLLKRGGGCNYASGASLGGEEGHDSSRFDSVNRVARIRPVNSSPLIHI